MVKVVSVVNCVLKIFDTIMKQTGCHPIILGCNKGNKSKPFEKGLGVGMPGNQHDNTYTDVCAIC